MVTNITKLKDVMNLLWKGVIFVAAGFFVMLFVLQNYIKKSGVVATKLILIFGIGAGIVYLYNLLQKRYSTTEALVYAGVAVLFVVIIVYSIIPYLFGGIDGQLMQSAIQSIVSLP